MMQNNEIIEDLEYFTKEYKELLYSKEYQMGKSVQNYIRLLKKFKFITIVKNLAKRKGISRDNYILTKEGEKKEDILNDSSKNRIVVYTALFGKYDTIKDPVIKPDNIDYYIITDQEISSKSKWKKFEFNEFPKNLTNIEKNRYCKMNPHKLFKDYEYSIYIDGNVFITNDLTRLINNTEVFPISMHKHKNRMCVYEEIDTCIRKNKDTKENLMKHKELLEKNGVPKNIGLLEATIIARKHNEKICIKLMDEWWKEFKNYSKRDQISLIDILWKNNINVDSVATMGNNTFDNNLFVIMPHN